ncbi:HU family DNA-binding protein [Porphyromonas gulae]|uniref:HU family DNA-binding protein n=1 Tax=Porphyromonas gulae TaxID=111105 RepID=UPI0009B8AD09|nr:HU family DNA-binding protein [Porphyromonas gulae]
MAKLKYKIAARKLNIGSQKGKTVYIAQPVNLGRISFEDFVKEVADGSTVDAADVKAVLSRLHVVIERLTARSFSVECGELGTFRPSFGSKSVEKPEDFKVSMIRPAKILFTPKPAFKNSLRSTGFELYGQEEASSSADTEPSTPSGPVWEVPTTVFKRIKRPLHGTLRLLGVVVVVYITDK